MRQKTGRKTKPLCLKDGGESSCLEVVCYGERTDWAPQTGLAERTAYSGLLVAGWGYGFELAWRHLKCNIDCLCNAPCMLSGQLIYLSQWAKGSTGGST